MTKEEAINLIADMDSDKYTAREAVALEMAIKALEAPPNDNWEGYSKRLWKSAYKRGKADAEQRWIPVSERLPEIDTTHGCNASDVVLVCLIDRKRHMGFYCDDTKWRFCDSGEAKEPFWEDVVEWMPLPEPYKAESNLDSNPIDIDKAVEHYDGTLEVLKGIDLEDKA